MVIYFIILQSAIFVSFDALVEGMLKCIDSLHDACNEMDATALTEQMKTLKISTVTENMFKVKSVD